MFHELAASSLSAAVLLLVKRFLMFHAVWPERDFQCLDWMCVAWVGGWLCVERMECWELENRFWMNFSTTQQTHSRAARISFSAGFRRFHEELMKIYARLQRIRVWKFSSSLFFVVAESHKKEKREWKTTNHNHRQWELSCFALDLTADYRRLHYVEHRVGKKYSIDYWFHSAFCSAFFSARSSSADEWWGLDERTTLMLINIQRQTVNAESLSELLVFNKCLTN